MTSDPERSEAVTSTCNRPQFGDFPTIEFVGADGVRREHDFQRAPHAPWQALLVEREAVDGEMRYVGTEQLRELRVNGEPVTTVSLVDVLEGP